MGTPRDWPDERVDEAYACVAEQTEAYGALQVVAGILSERWGKRVTASGLKDVLRSRRGTSAAEIVADARAGLGPTVTKARSDAQKNGSVVPEQTDTEPSDIDPRLIDFATHRQREFLYALLRYRDEAVAADKLGTTVELLRDAVASVRKTAAQRGYSPPHDWKKQVPTGYHVRGVSTLYDKDGNVSVQWVKSQTNREYQHEVLIEAMKGLAEPFAGKSENPPKPKHLTSDLMAVFPLGDPHFGLLAWHMETGNDFDLKTAENQLVEAVDKLVDLAPPCDQALIANLGDFFHTDNSTNRTLRSGNALDVDSRWSKILSVGVRAMRRCIDRAAEKFGHVQVVCEIGNHDDHSAIMLALCLEQYYTNNPRVTIDTSPSLFHWFRFGKNLIGINHGDKAKPQDLPGIMATDRAKDWGETEHRYFYVGHIHHERVKEYPGCIVENFRTLAARDSWHAGMGYRSGRDMKCDVLHREHGRILRHTVGLSMLGAA